MGCCTCGWTGCGSDRGPGQTRGPRTVRPARFLGGGREAIGGGPGGPPVGRRSALGSDREEAGQVQVGRARFRRCQRAGRWRYRDPLRSRLDAEVGREHLLQRRPLRRGHVVVAEEEQVLPRLRQGRGRALQGPDHQLPDLERGQHPQLLQRRQVRRLDQARGLDQAGLQGDRVGGPESRHRRGLQHRDPDAAVPD